MIDRLEIHKKYGFQKTIARRACVNGFGFWSGQDVLLEFLPAPENYGIRFVRTDMAGEEPLPALLEYRIAKPRQTSLARGDFQVDMVEHVMSALNGLFIDNCQVRINGPEMPGIDGSAMPFVKELGKAGIKIQSAPKKIRIVTEPVSLITPRGEVCVFPSESGEISYRYDLDYASKGQLTPPIPTQSFETVLSPSTYVKEIAPARTFLTYAEADQLLELGLCRRVTPRDVLVFGDKGPVNNRLRYDTECARHKTLDMIGDFALAGELIVGRFHAKRSGHQLNADLLVEILDRCE